MYISETLIAHIFFMLERWYLFLLQKEIISLLPYIFAKFSANSVLPKLEPLLVSNESIRAMTKQEILS